MRVPREVLDQIRDRLRISEVVGEYVRLTRDGGGGRLKGLCPFHNEKSPSFSVNEDRGFYYCFGCHATGDIFQFLVNHVGLTFGEAVTQLAGRAGVDLPTEGTRDEQQERQDKAGREAYFQVTGFARDFFMQALAGPEGEEAREYFSARGVDEDTLRRFQLGYAPDGWTHLVDAATASSLPAAWLERAGLARRKDDRVYDAFRHRVMFPILDISGKPLAFSGRSLRSDDGAKYINSPETKFYTKGDNLYGLHEARKGMRARDQVVLVEGNFDVVTLHAAGIDEAVAPLGTALTPKQVSLLRRYSRRVVLAFDGDRAGRAAALKAFEVLLTEGVDEVHLVNFSEGEDPDSFVSKFGGAALREKIQAAPSMISVVLDESTAPGVVDADPVARRRAVEASAQWLKLLSDPFVRQQWREEVARRLHVDERLIFNAERAQNRTDARNFPEQNLSEEVIVERLRLSPYEEALIQVIDAQPGRLDRIARQQLYRIMPTSRFGFSLEKLARAWSEGARDWRVLIEALEDRSIATAMLGVLAGQSMMVGTNEEDFEVLLRELQGLWVRSRLEVLELELNRYFRDGDHEGVRRVITEQERLQQHLEHDLN